jgi:hypothetical protein
MSSPDVVEVALGGEAPLGHHEHASEPEASDLVEDVAENEHAAAVGAEGARNRLDEVEALAGVEALERLVEHDHLGLVHERRATFTRWRMPLE